jgi:ribosomal protein S18 acetylase RimI-like enzyme
MKISRPTDHRFDETLALLQAADRDVWGETDWTASELREEWDGLDVARDAWLVDVAGRLAGVMHLYDRRGARFLADGYVHPLFRGRGVGSTLLELAETRARERQPEVPRGACATLATSFIVGDAAAPLLLQGRGFTHVRSGFRMVADLSAVDLEPVWPARAELVPFDADAHGRRLHAAVETAFADEWGFERRPYDAWAKKAFATAGFDPALVTVAWSEENIAGFAFAYPKRMGDWGWIWLLGVLPAWRRRGLGLALLRESFRRIAATGETVAALGVDGANPTGATRLYERAGMRVLWQADTWEKPLR